MQDFPHAATWEDGQWRKDGGCCTCGSSGYYKEGASGRDLPILRQRASGEGPTAPELGQRERRVPQIGTCCLNAVERRDYAHPPFPPADGMRPDH